MHPYSFLALSSGEADLCRIVPIPRSSIRAESEAAVSRAVTDLKQAVRTQKGFSFISSQVVDRLQVIVDSNVTQLLPPLQAPPPHKENPYPQSQNQDQKNTEDCDSGG